MAPADRFESPVAAHFRATMRRFPATVTIVTAHDGVRSHGMTVTAVTSLSMEPPSLIVCLNSRTLLHEMLRNGAAFAVNVLAREQAHLSDAFSGKITPEDRFKSGGWKRDAAGMMVLPGAHARVICRQVAAMPHGTHTVFIGEVVRAEIGAHSDPLLYENARYCVSQPAA